MSEFCWLEKAARRALDLGVVIEVTSLGLRVSKRSLFSGYNKINFLISFDALRKQSYGILLAAIERVSKLANGPQLEKTK